MGSHTFEVEALLLVLPTTDYQRRVPAAIGTTITDMAVDFISQSQPANLMKSWKALCCAIQSRQLGTGTANNQIFCENYLASYFAPFSTSTIRGSTNLRSHGLRLNLIAEPLDSTQLPPSVQCSPSYCILEPGSNRVAVGIRNILAKAITIPSKTCCGSTTTGQNGI